MSNLKYVLAALVIVILSHSMIASASILSYEFTVNITNGPLEGTVANGGFSISDSLTPPDGSNFLPRDDLLLSFYFEWNGIIYDTSNANSSGLRFYDDDSYELLLFGKSCFVNGCLLTSGQDNWLLAISFSDLLGSLQYTTPVAPGFYAAPITYKQVPLPASLFLMATALFGLIASGSSKI